MIMIPEKARNILVKTSYFDNYKKNEIEKFVYRSKNQTNHEIDLNNNIKLIQIIGNNFSNKTYKPLVLHNTGFNLSILKELTLVLNHH